MILIFHFNWVWLLSLSYFLCHVRLFQYDLPCIFLSVRRIFTELLREEGFISTKYTSYWIYITNMLSGKRFIFLNLFNIFTLINVVSRNFSGCISAFFLWVFSIGLLTCGHDRFVFFFWLFFLVFGFLEMRVGECSGKVHTKCSVLTMPSGYTFLILFFRIFHLQNSGPIS